MTLPLLLDTCALIWLAGADAGQAAAAEAALVEARAASRDILLSPMSAWEVGMLAAKGRLRLAMPPRTWLDRVMLQGDMRWADLTTEILLASSTLPGTVQGDPADRIIIATAREFGLCLLTRDRKTLDYARQGHVIALEC